jgi:hypothetical protein
VALSGTLDSFALPDVLRLLASTKKTGRLRVTGERGSGSVWVADGEIVSTEHPAAASIDSTHADVLFGLLRFDSGSFTFEADAPAVNASEPDLLEAVLGTAEDMLIEWRAIEEVVPSLDVFVTLSPEPTNGDVMIDGPRWRCIAAVAGGATADSVGVSLVQGELEVCRTIKELVELGLLEIGEAPSEPEVLASSEPEVLASSEPEVLASPEPQSIAEPGPIEPILGDAPEEKQFDSPLEEELGEQVEAGVGGDLGDLTEIDDLDSRSDEFEDALADVGVVGESVDPATEPANAPIADDNLGRTEPIVTTAPGLAGLGPSTGLDHVPNDPPQPVVEPIPEMAPGPDAATDPGGTAPESMVPEGMDAESASGPFGAGTAEHDDGADLDPAEMARQLANLSPKAAKAVAAAARASTDAERDAALAAVEAEDDTVNRGLLLKFLGSVDG